MIYGPPTGREKKILRMFKKLDNLGFDADEIKTPGVACTYGHALDGVRTNGHEHLVSLSSYRYEWNEAMEETRECLKEWNAHYREVKRVHRQFEAEIKKYFRICSKCNGKGGKYYTRDSTQWDVSRTKWEDCEKCNGRGLIEK